MVLIENIYKWMIKWQILETDGVTWFEDGINSADTAVSLARWQQGEQIVAFFFSDLKRK